MGWTIFTFQGSTSAWRSGVDMRAHCGALAAAAAVDGAAASGERERREQDDR
jgi:hypothetical protein